MSILHGVRWSESDAVLPTLLEMLNDPFPEVRGEAICGLAWMKTDTILPHLIRALEDEADSVRRQARWVFERRRPDLARQAVPELMNILESGKPSGRVSAALILAELGHEGMQALPLLRQELQSLEPEVRLAAAIAIARIQPESLRARSNSVCGAEPLQPRHLGKGYRGSWKNGDGVEIHDSPTHRGFETRVHPGNIGEAPQ